MTNTTPLISFQKLGMEFNQQRVLEGINLDIMHYRIAGPEAGFPNADFLDDRLGAKHYWERIVHTHIADQATGMHAVDQPLGRHTDLGHMPGAFCAFLKYFEKRRRTYDPLSSGLPFSGSVALELEGCSRIEWIHESVPALRRLTRYAQSER